MWGATILNTGNSSRNLYFNPRSPCGERQRSRCTPAPGDVFQSTLPVWGATIIARPHTKNKGISIHAPRVGSDRCMPPKTWNRWNFNPRSPCGGATASVSGLSVGINISIHAPRVGSDYEALARGGSRYEISIHAPRVGSDSTCAPGMGKI